MNIALFDMDGTLTEPRQKMKSAMVKALINLQQRGFEIGIVSGSDMNYIVDQCDILFGVNNFDFTKVHFLPCNGTKYYKFNNLVTRLTIYENDMINEIGQATYKKIISFCLAAQQTIIEETDCPLTARFFDYRGTLLNWCPIGRLAKLKDRSAWESIDKDNELRRKWLKNINDMFEKKKIDNVTVKLGGDTSFDIYPKGWDKSYCLKNFEGYDKIFFVGDRCFNDGNDREIYNAVLKRKNGHVFNTDSPEKTIDFIKYFILNGNFL